MERKKSVIWGLNIDYLQTNFATNKNCLVILHGWGARAERWANVLELLEEQGIFAIAPDLPGFGNSDSPKEPWTLDNYERFVSEFLRHLNIQGFGLLGHSFGGRIAIKFAADNLPGLNKLFLVASAGVTPRNKLRIGTYKIATKIAKPIFSIPPLNIFANLTRKIIYKVSGSHDYYLQNGYMRQTFKNTIDEDLTPLLSRIHSPTFIIWGDDDKMTPLSDARIMDKNIRNSKLTILEGGSHSPNVQMPKKLAETIANNLTNKV
jgi:pimeloyl-ACP methyl ester carboxylesterase